MPLPETIDQIKAAVTEMKTKIDDFLRSNKVDVEWFWKEWQILVPVPHSTNKFLPFRVWLQAVLVGTVTTSDAEKKRVFLEIEHQIHIQLTEQLITMSPLWVDIRALLKKLGEL